MTFELEVALNRHSTFTIHSVINNKRYIFDEQSYYKIKKWCLLYTIYKMFMVCGYYHS